MSDEGFERWAQRRLESAHAPPPRTSSAPKYRPGIPSRADRGRVPGDFLGMPAAAARMGTSRSGPQVDLNRPESGPIRLVAGDCEENAKRRNHAKKQAGRPCEPPRLTRRRSQVRSLHRPLAEFQAGQGAGITLAEDSSQFHGAGPDSRLLIAIGVALVVSAVVVLAVPKVRARVVPGLKDALSGLRRVARDRHKRDRALRREYRLRAHLCARAGSHLPRLRCAPQPGSARLCEHSRLRSLEPDPGARRYRSRRGEPLGCPHRDGSR